MKIIENGVHDISNDDYHASSAISRSALWQLRKSPYHYWYNYLSQNKVPFTETPAMQTGTLVHCLSLEPDEFDKRYAMRPALEPLPKAGFLKDLGREEFDRQKAQREEVSQYNKKVTAEFDEYAKDRIIIDEKQFEQATIMTRQLKKDMLFQSLIPESVMEKSIYFTHKPTGIQCKVRPDAWNNTIITDVKTTADASYRGFQGSAYKFGYYLQAGMISEALRSIDIEMSTFVFACVESKPPYCSAVYTLYGDEIEYGVCMFNDLMQKLEVCLKEKKYPCYMTRTLHVPRYATYDED